MSPPPPPSSQLWRLFTSFGYAGSGIPLLFDLFLFHRTSSQLEVETHLLDAAAYAWSVAFLAAGIQVLNLFLQNWFLFRVSPVLLSLVLPMVSSCVVAGSFEGRNGGLGEGEGEGGVVLRLPPVRLRLLVAILRERAKLTDTDPALSSPLSQPLLIALVHLWARANPTTKVSLFGLVSIPSTLYPLALLFLDFIQGGPEALYSGLSGLLVAHAYWFATEGLPVGKRVLFLKNPPSWWRGSFPPPPGGMRTTFGEAWRPTAAASGGAGDGGAGSGREAAAGGAGGGGHQWGGKGHRLGGA